MEQLIVDDFDIDVNEEDAQVELIFTGENEKVKLILSLDLIAGLTDDLSEILDLF